MAQHGVEFVHTFHELFDVGKFHAQLFSHLFLPFWVIVLGQKFVQRRIQQTDSGRAARQSFKHTFEVFTLQRQQSFESFFVLLDRIEFGSFESFFLEFGKIVFAVFVLQPADSFRHQDQSPERHDAVAFKEHVFGTAQADTFGTELDCHSSIMGCISIGADAQFAVFISQCHNVAKGSGQLRIDRFHFTGVNRSGGTVQADPVAFFDGDAVDSHLAGFVVDIDFAATGYTACSHATGNHGSVAGHTAPGSENTLGYMHTANIFGAGFDTAEDHGFTVLAPNFGIFSRKHRHTGCGTGAGRQTNGKFLSFAFGTLDKYRVQKLVKLGRFHPQNSGLFVDQAFFNKVGGDFYCGSSGAFAVTGLEHEEFAIFNGKFHILHIFIMLFQLDADVVELFETFGHGFFQRRIFSFADIFGNVLAFCPDFAARQRDLLGGTDTGNHIFALGIDKKFAVKVIVFAGGGVAGECHAGSGIVAGVAEDHCLNIHCGTDQAPDVVDFPVADGTGIIP